MTDSWLPARRLATCLAVVLLGLLPASSVGASEVQRQVEDTVDRALAILGDHSLPKDVRLRQVETIVFDQFDFQTMSRLVLARNWKRFSEEQKAEFIEEYKQLLSRSYGMRLDRFGEQSVEVTGEQAEPRGDVTVHTRVVGGKYDGALIDFRMRQRDGSWRAIDVVIEGVSLVSSYRSQFGDIVSKQGPAALLAKMREKNSAPIELGEAG